MTAAELQAELAHWLTTSQAAEEWEESDRTVRYRVAHGYIPAVELPCGHVLVPREPRSARPPRGRPKSPESQE